VPQNCLLEVIELPQALETSFEGVAEVAQTSRFVGLSIRGEVNSVPERRNGVLEVPQLSEVIESIQ
jgi:hypothetical protein